MKKMKKILILILIFLLGFGVAANANPIGVDSLDPRVKTSVLKRAAVAYVAAKTGKENAVKKNKARWEALAQKKKLQLKNCRKKKSCGKIRKKLFLNGKRKRKIKNKKVAKKK